jgi:hypothetical protein
MATLSPEEILDRWESLDSDEQQTQVVQHLRARLSGAAFYREAEQRDATPEEPLRFWYLLSSSCATMIPPEWIARFGVSYTPLDLYKIRAKRQQPQRTPSPD